VAAALPGGDPLAAALAASETPAPELVANAGSMEGLRPWVAIGCLAVVFAGLGLLCFLRQRHDLINQIPMENSSRRAGRRDARWGQWDSWLHVDGTTGRQGGHKA